MGDELVISGTDHEAQQNVMIYASGISREEREEVTIQRVTIVIVRIEKSTACSWSEGEPNAAE